ncbi:2-C-methyl-D-erythritol 4-phosphate cytidylyltransferase [Geobacter sp.]|uniref:2-C-methyl-D-erythritol 4-phosphate cytidylyltransferase n=1 Tax=Geobacter sp. TaxID=46610 RepID=UPI002638347C|nr:2-C-methyl-D-erythritol 4-phosphate cytidylyltransferase [Geobacter sp.]
MGVFALIPAAGMGKRMGASINKQYLLLDGRPILAHTLSVFEKAPFVDGICVVIPEDEIPYCREQVVERYGFTKVRQIVAGGKERQQSVLNGLRAMEGTPDDDVVLIHDGVRPFVTADILSRAIAVARESDGALVAVPAKDTVKVVEEGVITATPPRETLWLAQTPQAFRYAVIRAAHEVADAERFLGTDDAMLVERLGRQVRVVVGDYRNIKITTPEDMILAGAFLRETAPFPQSRR